MIFNNTFDDNNIIAESPYPLGIEGALMHVYETECNYNAMMKAVGISELKYYQETGKELFLNEAGAIKGFLTKAKNLFEKIIHKIGAILSKVISNLSKFVMTNKRFVTTYKNKLLGKKYNNFSVDDIYPFDNLTDVKNNLCKDSTEFNKYKNLLAAVKSFKPKDGDNYKSSTGLSVDGMSLDSLDSDSDKEHARNNFRNGIIPDSADNFNETITKYLYGEKGSRTFDVADIKNQLALISESKDAVKNIKDTEKGITKKIKEVIKELNAIESGISTDDKEKASAVIKVCNNSVEVLKNFSEDYTTVFGALSKAYIKRTQQAKSVCVKALAHNHSEAKDESAILSDYDIFAGVTIR